MQKTVNEMITIKKIYSIKIVFQTNLHFIQKKFTLITTKHGFLSREKLNWTKNVEKKMLPSGKNCFKLKILDTEKNDFLKKR